MCGRVGGEREPRTVTAQHLGGERQTHAAAGRACGEERGEQFPRHILAYARTVICHGEPGRFSHA